MAIGTENAGQPTGKILSRPRISAAEQKFATVLVGESQKHFIVHEHLLTHYSNFFRVALTGNSREAEEKEVKLWNTEPAVFEFFVHWLYYQRFPDASQGDNTGLVISWGISDDDCALWMNLIGLYILGGHYIIPKLQEDVLNCLFYHVNEGLVAKIPMDHAIRYLIDLSVHYNCCDEDGFTMYETDGMEEYPPAYLLGVARRATQIIGGIYWQNRNVNDFELDLCDYHDHLTDEARNACKKEQKKTRACARALAAASEHESKSELES